MQAENMASLNIFNHTFPFLQLPPEVRNMIYLFALPSDPVLPRGPKSTSVWRDDSGQWRRSTPPIQPQHPSLNIFLVCRQLHQEASYIFYHHAHFVIKLQRTYSHRQTTGTQIQNPRFESKDLWKNQYARVRNIDLELSWPLSRPVAKCLHLYRTSRLLENFQNLETVTVRFKPLLQRKGSEGFESSSWQSPDKIDCEQLLRSLEWLPKKYPNLCIEIETFRSETGDGTLRSLTMYKLEEYMKELRDATTRPAGREQHDTLANFIG
ncbi:hypothetical protein N7G274_005129 [Stereocaulon virgatum]|uniref:2EXR domain-containing protein n=1 Tax=Stereocaulon virgatum TaxID=373712 RepID=A0ABR4AAN4_9LECA